MNALFPLINGEGNNINSVAYWIVSFCCVSLELPHHHVCKEEEENTDQQPQNNNSSLDQEYPEPPQIKEELCSSQEEYEVKLKHETEFLTPFLDKENDYKEGTEKVITS